MKKVWKIVGIATLVAILGVAAVGAVVYAQDDGSGGPFDFNGKFREAIAGILGISVEEYDAAVEQAQDQVVDEALAEGWLTEEQAELLQQRMDRAPGFGMPDMGKGFGRSGHGMMGREDNLLSIAADKLGMELTDLLTELQDDKSIADVAEEKGVDTQVIVDAYLAQVKENLDEAVTAGRITQKQADYQLQQVEQRVTDQLDKTGVDGFHGGRRHGGPMGSPDLDGDGL
jgi:hypothetical protein